MGYPMTYQRVIHRSELAEGGYDDKTQMVGSWPLPGPERFDEGVDYVGVVMDAARHYRDDLERMQGQRRMLLGDLRRLARDTIDESATCRAIADRTGTDPEIVQAVLREFMRW